MALILPLLALGGCSTVDGLKNDLALSYDKVAGVFNKAIDPIKEKRKQLPVYDGTCPDVTVRPDLTRLVDFQDPSHTADNAKVSEVVITSVNNVCRIENESLVMQIDMALAGKTGPKARANPKDKPSFAYPYFIAVTDSQGTVVSKEIFAASLAYGSTQNELKQTETVFQTMPFPDASLGITYSVVVGFQLTEDQLAYNQGNAVSSAPMVEPVSAPAPSNIPKPASKPKI